MRCIATRIVRAASPSSDGTSFLCENTDDAGGPRAAPSLRCAAMARHDPTYKLLFSHPEMVRDLLVGFVREDWVKELDFDSLEKVNSSYVSDNLRGRTGDLVWRARWREQSVYIYVV